MFPQTQTDRNNQMETICNNGVLVRWFYRLLPALAGSQVKGRESRLRAASDGSRNGPKSRDPDACVFGG